MHLHLIISIISSQKFSEFREKIPKILASFNNEISSNFILKDAKKNHEILHRLYHYITCINKIALSYCIELVILFNIINLNVRESLKISTPYLFFKKIEVRNFYKKENQCLFKLIKLITLEFQ